MADFIFSMIGFSVGLVQGQEILDDKDWARLSSVLEDLRLETKREMSTLLWPKSCLKFGAKGEKEGEDPLNFSENLEKKSHTLKVKKPVVRKADDYLSTFNREFKL